MFQWAEKSLPQPEGKYKVGFTDLLTPGLPDTSSLLRILYPARDNLTNLNPASLWTDSTPRDNCISFMQGMIQNWPSWVPDSEFLLLPTVRCATNETTFPLAFKAAWDLFAERITIPILPDVAIHDPPPNGWPVVFFSHGMGCSRGTMSQIGYQLASQGVVVVCIEHRDGSGGGSFYRQTRGGDLVEIPHRLLSKEENEIEVREKQVIQRGEELLRAVALMRDLQTGKPIDNVLNDSSLCVASPLAGTMDLSCLHLLGHSFGGCTVLYVASLLKERGTQVSGLMALDPWMFPVHRLDLEVDTSVFILHSEAFLIPENMEVIQMAVKTRKEKNNDVELEVQTGAVHLSATDIPMVFPQTYVRKGLGFMAEGDPEECIKEINRFVWSFFSRTMENKKA